MNRILPRRARLEHKPANILRLITDQDRESLEVVYNLFDVVEQGIAMHQGCCNIYSADAISVIRENRDFIGGMIDAHDALASGTNPGVSEVADVDHYVSEFQA